MKEYILIGMVALVLVISIVQSFQISSLKDNIKSGSGNGEIDMSGWTEQEKMMYEHHGTMPTRLQGGQARAPQSSGMVGGC